MRSTPPPSSFPRRETFAYSTAAQPHRLSREGGNPSPARRSLTTHRVRIIFRLPATMRGRYVIMANGLIDAAEHKQLFLDDYAIETMDGLVRTLHPVDKQGPVIEPDESIGQLAVQSSQPAPVEPGEGPVRVVVRRAVLDAAQAPAHGHHGHPRALRHVAGRADLGAAQPGPVRVERLEGQQPRTQAWRDRPDPHPPRRARARPGAQVQGHVRQRPPRVRRLARRVRLDDARRARRAERGHLVHALRRVHGAVPHLPQAQHRVGPVRLAGEVQGVRRLVGVGASLPHRRAGQGERREAHPGRSWTTRTT